MCIHLCTSARDLKSLCFWVYFACVCALVHGHCCRHRSPISPNATWQFWIRLLAIQGYSAHHRHTSLHTSTNLCPYNPCSSCTDVQYNAQYHPHDQHSYSVLHEYLLCRCCCIPLRDVCADQRTSDLALVVCFWKHFLVLYVPVLWMVSFTEDINEQPWGLHEHPTVQYKQHLSRDHNELWAKFSIEMLWL